jgi:dehydrogenase/reductase SDR family protein X
LHILVNNAGVMLAPFELTKIGYELHYAVNYLGHVLLTRLLLDIMVATGTPDRHTRIINVSSCVHAAGTLDFESMNPHPVPARYSAHAAYAQSKLALLMFSYTLASKLRDAKHNIDVHAVHPGVVDTALYRHVVPILQPVKWLCARFSFYTPLQGAATTMTAACSPAFEGQTGLYLSAGRPVRAR